MFNTYIWSVVGFAPGLWDGRGSGTSCLSKSEYVFLNAAAHTWLCNHWSATVHLPWSIEAYTDSLTPSQNIGNSRNEANIRHRFPPLFSHNSGELLPLQDEPCTIVDCTGIIVLWYLPDALSDARNVIISDSSSKLLLTLNFRMSWSVISTNCKIISRSPSKLRKSRRGAEK